MPFTKIDINEHDAELLKLLTEHLPDMLWVKDINGKYIYTNKAMCDNLLMAKDTQEPIGKDDLFFALRERKKHQDIPDWHTFGELCHNSDLTVIKNNKPMRFEEFGNVQGKLLYLEVFKAPIYNNKGDITGTVGVGRDITQLKQSQEALSKSEMRWRSAIEGIGDGLWDWNILTDEVYFSSNWKKMIGFEPDEISNDFVEWEKRVHPDDLERVFSDIQRCMRGEIKVYTAKHRMLCKNGEYKWILTRGIIIEWSDEDKPKRMIGTHTDIDSHEKAYAHVKLLKQRFKSMFKGHSSVMLLSEPKSGAIIDANTSAQNFYGYTHEEFLKLSIDDINILPNEEIIRHRKEAIEKKINHFIFPHRLKDGTKRIVEVFASPIVMEDGQFIYSIINDVTEAKQNEEKLKNLSAKAEADKQRYEALMKYSSDGVYILGLDGTLKECNKRACKMLGYHMDEMLQLHVNDWNAMIPTEKVPALFSSITTDTPKTFETRHKRKDGSFYDASISAIKIIINNEPLIYASVRDITKQKAIENEMSRLNTKMTALTQNVPGVVYTYQYDPSGKSSFPYASDHIYDIYGVMPEEVKEDGSKVFEVLHPDDIQRVSKSIMRSFENLDIWEEEYRVNHPTKGLIWVKGSAQPQKQPDGNVVWQGYIFDITQRKKAELDIQNAKEYYEKLLEYASDGIHILDTDGNIIACSQSFATQLGYEYNEVKSLNVKDWDVSIPQEKLLESIKELIQTPKAFETTHKRKDGSIVAVQINAKGIELNNQLYLYASARDISQIKMMERQLHNILNLSPIAVRIAKFNDKGVVFANEAYKQLLHIDSTKDVLGKDPSNYYADAKVYDEILTQVQNGKAIYHKEIELKIAEENVWALCSYMPIEYNGEKAVLGWFYDLTSTKHLIKQLAIQKEFTNHIVQNANAIIAVIQPDGTMSLLNEYGQNFTGYSQKEVASQPYFWKRFLNEKIRSKVIDIISNAKNGEIVNTYQNTWVSKTGEERMFEWSNTIKTKPDGTLDYIYTIGIDIQEKIEAQEKILAQKEEFKTIFEISREGIAILDLESNFLDCNDAYLSMTGFSRQELLSTSCVALSTFEDKERAKEAIRLTIKKGYLDHFEKHCVVNNGKKMVVQMALSLMPDKKRILISAKDITMLKEHEKELRLIAHYDTLTKLPNRMLLSDRMHQSMITTHRNNQKMAIVYLDLDGFKQVNDTYGHDVGDLLLIELSKRMLEVLREEDTLARLGGDEFVVILGNQSDDTMTLPVLERLLEAASASVSLEVANVSVSASIGVTFYSKDHDFDADILLRQADQAMYEAKLRGKNQIVIFDEIQGNSLQTGEYALAIKNALYHNEFVLYYQPKVHMKTGNILGVEALIRWNNPEQGFIYPKEFLPSIENRPLMLEIDKWVFNHALGSLSFLLEKNRDLKVSINISAYTFKQPDFIHFIDEIIARHPSIKPTQIDIEILESSSLHEVEEVRKIIRRLHNRGISISLDDFGTGYSTLAYLKKLGIDTLKIDRSFVVDILHDPGDLSIINASVGLSEAFHAKVLAEGVETIAQGEILIQLGCELAQGYAIARPMSQQELHAWLKKWRTPKTWENTQKAEEQYLPLLHAGVEFRHWVYSLENYLQKKSNFMPEMDLKSSNFGRWLTKYGKRFFDKNSLSQIEQLQRKSHLLAKELISSKQPKPEALEKLYKLQNEVLSLLSINKYII